MKGLDPKLHFPYNMGRASSICDLAIKHLKNIEFEDKENKHLLIERLEKCVLEIDDIFLTYLKID